MQCSLVGTNLEIALQVDKSSRYGPGRSYRTAIYCTWGLSGGCCDDGMLYASPNSAIPVADRLGMTKVSHLLHCPQTNSIPIQIRPFTEPVPSPPTGFNDTRVGRLIVVTRLCKNVKTKSAATKPKPNAGPCTSCLVLLEYSSTYIT